MLQCWSQQEFSHGLRERLEGAGFGAAQAARIIPTIWKPRCAAVVGVRAIIPPDAFTADTLGTERAGNGVLIRSDGLVLTIGYLVTEAETIWLTLIDGRDVPGTVLGLRPGDRLRADPGAGPARPAGAADRRFERGVGRRARRGRRRRRAAAFGRGPHRRQAGIRRLLGIRASTRRSSPRRRIPTGAAPR